ncbi:MAG: HTH-type transcriptional repressor NemR [Syntrophus sp. SKADARSKE-3]|nr:HTH-type transcriptional repressor NemR [Syntrophus sp. SKADARSKE-3]
MSSPADTKNKILDIGESLVLSRGFNGFSYKNISTALGVKNAAIHYHFPSKCDLGIAIIERARRRFQRWSEEIEKKDLDEWQQLDNFFNIYTRYLESSESVCLSGALETEFKTLPEEMQKATRGLVFDLLAWTENLLLRGRDKGTFSFAGEPKDLAVVLLAIVQGALQMVRATEPSYFDAAMRQARLLLKR